MTTPGRFIAVVGPSGVGKDSFMQAMAARRPGLVLARRVITRPGEAGGEDYDGVTEAEFSALRDADAFALCWRAHGLRYGVPTQVDADLTAGRDVMANLSRAQLGAMQARFPRSLTILLTADQATLAARLTARGRENAAAIETRLARAAFALPPEVDAIEIDNTGPLDQTVAFALDLLYPVRA